jgi:hypothetical protein
LLVWDTIFDETHGALINSFILFTAPKAVEVASALAAIAILFLFAKLKILCSLRAHAIVCAIEVIPHIENIVLVVVSVLIRFSEESLHMLSNHLSQFVIDNELILP